MDLTYAFRMPVPVDEAWTTLSDLPAVVALVPGATVDSVTDDIATGQLIVKVGPVSVRYEGALKVQSQDPIARVAVLRGKGTEARGDGDATATVTVQLAPDGLSASATVVTIAAVLELSGRIARFRRGALHDVGERLVAQLAEGLGGALVTVPEGPLASDEVEDAIDEEEAMDETPPVPVIPPPPGAPEGAPPESDEVEVAVVEVEMIETELGDPFEAVEPDDADLDPTPSVDALAADPATAPTSSTAKKVGPVLIAIALVWLLKKLLSRSKD